MKKETNSYFAAFYFTANVGALASQLVTPNLKESESTLPYCGLEAYLTLYDLTWRVEVSYAAAFGLPAVLMIIAVIFFAVGTPWYRHVPVKGNVFWKLCLAIGRGIKRCFGKNKQPAEHFLDRAVGGEITVCGDSNAK